MFRTSIAILFLSGIISCQALAEVVGDLYSATVAVADQSEGLRATGVRHGLSDVFVKLTGSRAVLSDPGFAVIIQRADEYLTEYGYSEGLTAIPLDPDLEPQVTTMLDVSFASASVDRLLRDLFLPIWPADRPVIVVWLIARTEDGHEFIEATDDIGIFAAVGSALKRRGVPFKEPLYDLQDHLTLSPQQAWQIDEDRLAQSSRRYGVDYWLVLRVEGEQNGIFEGAWFMGGKGRELRGVTTAQSAILFAENSVDQAIDHFSLGLTYRAGQLGETVKLLVDSVNSIKDFTEVTNALANLEVVKSTRVIQIDKDQLYLELVTESDTATLIEMLEKNQRFRRVVNMGGRTQASIVEFQWRANGQ